MINLEILVAAILIISAILYGITGIADFGGGIWDLLAIGTRAKEQKNAISNSLAPVWEANHVWLIAIIVVLFTAFPKAFTIIMTQLFIPLFLIVIGIVLRGSTFIFRKYYSQHKVPYHLLSLVFNLSSLLVPALLGMCIGAIASGDLPKLLDDNPGLNIFSNPFSIACAFFTLTLSTHLSATYLAADSKHKSDLANDFRIRSLISLVVFFITAIFLFLFTKNHASYIYLKLQTLWVFEFIALIFFALDFLFLLMKRYEFARYTAAALVTMVISGWALAQYPYLIVDTVSIYNYHAPTNILFWLIAIVCLGGLILFPSFAYLYFIFIKAKKNI